MSRSRKKHPGGKLTSVASEKKDKQAASRKKRRACKRLLKKDNEAELHGIGATDSWSFSGDGKLYWSEAPDQYYRK